MIRMKNLIATSALALMLLILAFLKPWISVAIGLIALGVAGYLPQISRLHLSRRVSGAMLVLFIGFSLGQIALQYRQENDAQHQSALLAAALSNTQSFPFRIVVEPDRTPHIPVNVFDPTVRPFYTSRGPGIYASLMIIGGGDTAQSVSERPNIAPLYATYILNKPPVELLRPPYMFQKVDRLVMDVAEMTMIQWLLTVGATTLQENNETAPSENQSECPTISSIHNSFSHNQFIGYLADSAKHQYFLPFHIDFSQDSKFIGQLRSETSPQDKDKKRVIALSVSGYRLQISLRYEGLTRMSSQDVSDLGIVLQYNNVDLPFVMTENFRITLTVLRDESSLRTDMVINEFVSTMRRDFDWSIYKDTLLLTRNR